MNYYSKAITILNLVSKSNELKDKLILELVKKSPSAVCKAADTISDFKTLEEENEKEFLKHLTKLITQDRKIQAIKEYKSHSKVSLQDAKKFIDQLPQEEYWKLWKPHSEKQIKMLEIKLKEVYVQHCKSDGTGCFNFVHEKESQLYQTQL